MYLLCSYSHSYSKCHPFFKNSTLLEIGMIIQIPNRQVDQPTSTTKAESEPDWPETVETIKDLILRNEIKTRLNIKN